MDSVIVVYHKNIDTIYPKQWVEQFIESIRSQTTQDFHILEMDYGGTNRQLFPESIYFNSNYSNFIHALNFLILEARARGYKYLFNTNCDDFYVPDRIELQLQQIPYYDIVSSNFCLLNSKGLITHNHQFDKLDLKTELSKNHNIICHPAVCYKASFFDDFSYDPQEILHEDLKLWQRAISSKSFLIMPEMLCYHRNHSNSVCNSTDNR